MPRTFIRIGTGFIALLAVSVIVPRAAAAPAAKTETIVLVRHGEKPVLGLGQLDCQGLNRALALPAVIGKQFGKPDAIFAPDPAHTKKDYGRSYDYVRPLATIEPTAIAFGMPIDASIGVEDIEVLERTLGGADYRGALVLIAWEHKEIVKLARLLLAANGGDASAVPDWKGSDFDSIDVVTLKRSGANTSAGFEQRHEGLDGQATTCPGPPHG
jgi:hypothetical protein